MYVIIAGGGALGIELVKKFTESKKDVVVIDIHKENCDDLYASYGIEAVCGNATNISVLKAAGIEKADAVIATMRSDADNLAFTVLARSFAIPEIIVRMNNKSYLEAYKTAGVTKVLHVIDTLVDDIVHQVEKPKVQTVAKLGDGAVELFIIRVPENGKIVGKTVSEIASHRELTEESIIAGIFNVKEKDFIVPRGNTKIQGEADLFVITKPDLVERTAKYLLRT